MAVYVSQRQFRESFKRHLDVYRKAVQDGGKQSTHCMMLFYAVECGLKALILKKYRKDNSGLLGNDVANEIIRFFQGHDLNGMIRKLELPGRYEIPTPLKQGLAVKDLHSVWRYRDGQYTSDDGTEQTLEYAEHRLEEISKELEVRLR